MQIAHRRLDIRVPHPLLHPANVGLRDHPRAERVPKVMETQLPQPRTPRRGGVAAAQRRAVEKVAGLSRNDQVVLAREPRVRKASIRGAF
jgi:hypothetical protein